MVFKILSIVTSHQQYRRWRDWSRLLIGAIKAGKAYMITDEQLAEMVKSQVEEMDRQNEVCADKSKDIYDGRYT